MEDFYHRLSYSFGNEDWTTEKRALRIRKGDAVVCVTASGDRPLNLLTEECGSIASVDANPMQNALLELKRAAMCTLSYEEYLAFLGLVPCKHRLGTYKQLAARLDQRSHLLWQRHQQTIKRGVLFQGAIEKKLRLATFFVQLTRGKKVQRLFSFDDLAAQAEYAQKRFDTKLWRGFIDLFLQPAFTRFFLRDPGLYEFVDPEIHIGRYIHGRLHEALGRFLARESPFLSMILRGKVEMEHLPPYLRPEGVALIKERAHLVQVATDDLVSFLEKSPEGSYDCFSLSDVASYIPMEAFERMIRAIYHAARPGARFSIRQFLTNYEIPEKLVRYFARDRDLEERLSREDRCFVYKFMTGTVNKS